MALVTFQLLNVSMLLSKKGCPASQVLLFLWCVCARACVCVCVRACARARACIHPCGCACVDKWILKVL
jgi:hypothetical protein